jgi:hypothetical protein
VLTGNASVADFGGQIEVQDALATTVPFPIRLDGAIRLAPKQDSGSQQPDGGQPLHAPVERHHLVTPR